MPEINAGSMADIAFLLLIFFLVATTIDVDSGILRKLPPKLQNETEKPPPVKQRNLFTVLVNAGDLLLVEDNPLDIGQLKDKVKDFISNESGNVDLSEFKEVDIEGIGLTKVSKGIVSLQNDRGTSFDMYIRVQNELVAAFNELRDEFAIIKFGKKYENLNEVQQQAIQKKYPQAISEAEPVNVSKEE